MRIILQREVANLGAPGDVVQVADGYARNYLIPRGMAAPASRGALRHAERMKVGHEERQRKARGGAEELSARLAKMPVRLAAQAGEDGRLFGSITAHQIAEQVTEQLGEELDHRKIRLQEPIRSLGTHTVTVHLHPEVDATITLDVVGR